MAKLKEEKEDHEKKLNQSKQVLLAVRKKLASQNEEIQQKDAEIEKMKQKLSSSSESSSGKYFVQQNSDIVFGLHIKLCIILHTLHTAIV